MSTTQRGLRVIVCGGRKFKATEIDAWTLGRLLALFSPIEVVTGGATGADTWAREIAVRFGWPVTERRADWGAGRSAGPLRNAAMADYVKSNGGGVCVAFPGGSGTSSMLEHAQRRGLGIVDLRLSERRHG